MATTAYKQLIKKLIKILDSFDYVMLSPGILSQQIAVLKVALRTDNRAAFLRQLQKIIPFQVVQNKLDKTVLTTDLEKDTFITIELYHFFHSDRLTYLDIEAVLRNRVYGKNYYTPSWEHLIEFSILNSFLNKGSLNQAFIDRFKDLHVFLQEGLLDYFNTKFDTAFNAIYELSDYRSTIEDHFRKRLKQSPTNKFAKRVQLRWINMKRLLKRPAIYSFIILCICNF